MTRRVCLLLVCVAASLAAQPGNPRAGVFEPGEGPVPYPMKDAGVGDPHNMVPTQPP